MDPSEINNFENQWKKAFDEASETPPPSVWDEIEARLDHDEKDIIPLWWRRPKLWYAAASIIALLVVGGGYFINESTNITGPEVAGRISQQAPENKTEKADSNLNDSSSLVLDEVKADKIAKQESSTEKVQVRREGLLAGTRPKKSKEQSVKDIPVDSRAFIARADRVKEQNVANNTVDETFAKSASEAVNKEVTDLKVAMLDERMVAEAALTGLEVGALEGIDVSELDVFFQKRYVFYKPNAIQEEKLPELKKKGEYWAGIGLMPASFNPDVQIKDAPTAFSSAQNYSSQQSYRQGSATGTSKAGNSYAVQTQGGMKLSKHWSLEMGVSYLKGNSSYEGGGYVLNTSSARSTNMLEDALVNLSAAKSGVVNSPSIGAGGGSYESLAGNAFIDVNRNVSNNYQYLQLPLQAGFTLNPDKKLSYSLLGGMMANFFLSNELESAAGQMIRTTANDEVYRSMNWAATTGLRFNYKLSDRWKASLMGSYQRAVSSGFRANQSLESHPYLYGVSWGMRYSF